MKSGSISGAPAAGAQCGGRLLARLTPGAFPTFSFAERKKVFQRARKTRCHLSWTTAAAGGVAIGLSLLVGATPALAGKQVYVYTIVHPYYGEIGTLTDTIDRGPEVTRIDSRLRIKVEILGIAVYSQVSDTTEIMRGNRLISLQSVSEKDGRHLEVHGEAQGGLFVVNGTAGSSAGPAATTPSDPWLLSNTGEGTLIYPVTGRIAKARVSGGDSETISVNGRPVAVRHFWVEGDNHEDVWLNARGIPVMFRTVEDGTPIDFMLRDGIVALGGNPAIPVDRPVLIKTEKEAK
jgi:uncharacterized protein DUF6134